MTDSTAMTGPTIVDIIAARAVVRRYLPPTPTWSYPVLNETVGAQIFVKHENVQPTGAFKVRGGVNLLAGMPAERRSAGIVSCSTGNHAQSLAYAAREFGVPCTIVMPTNVNPVKLRAVEGLGAKAELRGEVFDDCVAHAAQIARDTGAELIGVADSPLIAGVATMYLELFESAPDLDAIFVPLGGGSSAAGACLVAAALAPKCKVIAVQSAQAPAGHDSWRAGHIVQRPNRTVVEGLSTGQGFESTQAILRTHLSDFLLVDDEQIHAAGNLMLTSAHTLAEGAGAAGLAALLQVRDQYAGRKVAVICSGGNSSPAEIDAFLRTR